MKNFVAPLGRNPGPQPPAGRLAWQAAVLVALGLSSSFMVVIAGFAVALTLIWPG